MPVHSNRAELERRLNDAIPEALIGAAQVYRTAVKNALTNPPEGGYTTGKWDHGAGGVAGSVEVGAPVQDSQGWYVSVGTNLPYAKYWELGFHRRLWVWFSEKNQRWYSRPGPTKYERVERWRPALQESREAMGKRFERILRHHMRASAPNSGA